MRSLGIRRATGAARLPAAAVLTCPVLTCPVLMCSVLTCSVLMVLESMEARRMPAFLHDQLGDLHDHGGFSVLQHPKPSVIKEMTCADSAGYTLKRNSTTSPSRIT